MYPHVHSRVIAGTAAWQSTSQQVTQNASKWDQVAQTVVDNSGRWNTAAETIVAKAAEWDKTGTTLTAKQPTWDDAALIATNHAQTIRQSTSSVTFHYDGLAITLGDAISLTDASGTWTFTDGTFIKQEPTE